jgi:hypothetical protein
MGVTDTQSYSLVIRDVFFDAVAGDPFFANYTRRKTPMLRVQAELLPYLGVYIADEAMEPDGDPNAGEVRFCHTLQIGFSVMIANNDQVANERMLDAAFWRIMNRLWPDPYIMNLIDTYNPHTGTGNPDNTIIESITRGRRRFNFGDAALVNETPVGELQYDVWAFFRTGWPPVIADDLAHIHVETGIKPGDTQAEMDQRLQVKRDYLFDISKRRPAKKEKTT